jgi:hypothetical protein
MSADKEFQRTVSAFRTAKHLLTLKSAASKGPAEISVRAAQNEIERQLVELYRALTYATEVGIDHDFFKIGGNSLKAVYLVSSISRIFDVQLSLVDIFKNAKVSDLALLIASRPGRAGKIPVLESQEYFPASRAQQLLWILDHQDHRHTGYNMPDSFSIEGTIDVPALQKAFRSLIERHESLRTTFVNVKGKLYQKIHEPGCQPLPFEFLDLTCHETAEKLAFDWIAAEIKTPFDLGTGPLMRARLLRIDAQQWIYILNLHHIIADGWSINELTRQLFRLYAGDGGTTTPNPVQYKDYVSWLNRLLSPSRIAEHRNYWLARLSGKLPSLLLSDKTRPDELDFEGKTLTVETVDGVTDKLKEFSIANGVTHFMLLQAIVALLLSKYSGEEDIGLGTPVWGRIHQQLDDQIGLFLNNIVLRFHVGPETTFLEFLGRIKNDTLEAFAHEMYPFDMLVNDLNLKGGEGRNPIYDVMIVMETNEPFFDRKAHWEGLHITDLEVANPVSKLDLTLFFKLGDTLKINLEYRTALFEQPFIDKMGADIVRLIDLVVEKPEMSLAGIKYAITTEEQRQKHSERQALLTARFDPNL